MRVMNNWRQSRSTLDIQRCYSNDNIYAIQPPKARVDLGSVESNHWNYQRGCLLLGYIGRHWSASHIINSLHTSLYIIWPSNKLESCHRLQKLVKECIASSVSTSKGTYLHVRLWEWSKNNQTWNGCQVEGNLSFVFKNFEATGSILWDRTRRSVSASDAYRVDPCLWGLAPAAIWSLARLKFSITWLVCMWSTTFVNLTSGNLTLCTSTSTISVQLLTCKKVSKRQEDG